MKRFHPLNEYCMEIQKGLFLIRIYVLIVTSPCIISTLYIDRTVKETTSTANS